MRRSWLTAAVSFGVVVSCGRIGFDVAATEPEATDGGHEATAPMSNGGRDASAPSNGGSDASPPGSSGGEVGLGAGGSGVSGAPTGPEAGSDAGEGGADATAPRCGDGMVDPGEGCDDGIETVSCNADCTPAACGDGVVNGALGEQCDDLGGQSTTCGPDCRTPAACSAGCGCASRFGHRYMFCRTEVDWPSADAACRAAGMRLVRLDDGGEAAWLDRTRVQNNVPDPWIGANDRASAGVWQWADGQTFWSGGAAGAPLGGLYSNWSAAQPDNGTSNDRACVFSNTTFTAESCASTRPYVCEAYVAPPATCGNGTIDPGEACDDRGDSSTCDGDCTRARCGDGYVNRAAREACDGGGTDPECPSSCARPSRAPGAVVLYDFRVGTGNTVPDLSGVTPALDLTISTPAAVSWVSDGLLLTGAANVATTAPTTKLVTACAASNTAAIEVWATPSTTLEGGPRSIFAFSGDPANRNFLLGQEAQAFAALLRTTDTALDATPPAGSAPVNTGARIHLVYTRTASQIEPFYLDASPVNSYYRTGDLSTWSSSFSLSVGNEPTATGREFHGTIHLAAVYCRELSASEVLQNYLAGP